MRTMSVVLPCIVVNGLQNASKCVCVQFFEKAASNVKENIGEEVQTDQLIKEACRNCLEHVRVRFFF